MNSIEKLKPVKLSWISHKKNGLGLVIDTYEGVDGITLNVKWENKQIENSLVPLNSISSGFQVGMEVKHVPSLTTDKSYGEGVVLKTRIVSGYSQVLVNFYESNKLLWLPYEQLSWIRGAKHLLLTNNFTNNTSPEKLRLKILAHAIENWNENTGSLSRLDIDPLPHQVHLVHHILESGHLNWLIADDVGLGKTIETGMLLKALQQRGQADRILLITPAGLTSQWKDELYHKFGLSEFRIYGENFTINEAREWGMYKHVIGSMDRLKDEDNLEKLLKADHWDIVIFDEGHRLTRREYGRKYTESLRFRLGNKLRNRTKAMVLLSATPHQGKSDKFKSLLMLLQPERKKEIQMIELNPEILSTMMIRNNKSDVTDLDGNFIFKGKKTNAIRIPSDIVMNKFDESLQEYLREGYRVASERGFSGNAIGFVMSTYRKLAASSAKAIYKALCNRKIKLTNVHNELSQIIYNEPSYDDIDDPFYAESSEDAVLNLESIEFFEGEMEALDTIISECQEVLGNDLKIKSFIDEIIQRIMKTNSKEKVLIFTEYRSTQDYIKEALEVVYGNSSVTLINGSMSHKKRRESIIDFENEGQFLVSTEAGGEGINLQDKCHIIVNYDLPWNPMRLAQRIGRLYRYGQEKRVIVFNLCSENSMDDQVIELMNSRLEKVVEDLSTVSGEYNERLSDEIIGEVAELLDVENIIKDATTEGIERTKERIDEALLKAKDATQKQRELFEYAASFDPNEAKEKLNITSEHVISFTKGMFVELNIEILSQRHKGLLWEIRIPEDITEELGVIKTRWNITFDRRIHSKNSNCEMMDMDNFIFKFLINTAKSHDFGGLTSSIKNNAGMVGTILFSYLRWQDSMGTRRRQELVAFQTDDNKNIKINTEQFSEWLKSTSNEFLNSKQNDARKSYAIMEKQADIILKQKSNLLLHPESHFLISGAVFHKND